MSMKKTTCLIMILVCFLMTFIPANAIVLNKAEQDVLDSLLIMFEDTLYNSSFDPTRTTAAFYGFPTDGEASEFRIYEMMLFGIPDGSDFAFIRFTRNGNPMNEYYGVYIETVGTDDARGVNGLALYFNCKSGYYPDFTHYKEMDMGKFSFISLTDEGMEMMADTRSELSIKHINEALDDYWK